MRAPLAVRQRGTSLLEVLVTLTIVAVGLLGLLALQSRSQSWQRDSFDRRAAAELSEQLVERIRGNHLGWAQWSYAAVGTPFDLAVPPAAGPALPACLPGACTVAELAARDLSLWTDELRRRLPVSAARLERNANLLGTLTVAWREPLGGAAAEAADPACDTMGLPGDGWRCLRTTVFP